MWLPMVTGSTYLVESFNKAEVRFGIQFIALSGEPIGQREGVEHD